MRLLAPNGHLIDQIPYLRIKAANLSCGRLPDGSNELRYGLWPTPRKANLLFVEEAPAAEMVVLPADSRCRDGGEPRVWLPRMARAPAWQRWQTGRGFYVCSQA